MRNIRKILSVLLGMAMMGTNVSAAYTERTTTADNSLQQPAVITDALAVTETRVHPNTDIRDSVTGSFQINYEYGEGGSISGPASANAGDTVTLTISPDDGRLLNRLELYCYGSKYQYNNFDKWSTSYSIKMPEGDLTIKGTFGYRVWVGDTMVTPENAGNILGDGNVSYDHDSSTLTFAEADPQITGLHENALIYSELDGLTIQADNGLNLSSDDAVYGIYTKGYLEIEGDLSVTMDNSKDGYAVYAGGDYLYITGNLTVTNPGGGGIRVPESYVNIFGDVQLSTKTEGIYADGEITIEGNITADADNGNILHSSNGGINVNGNAELSGNTYEILANEGVTVFGEATLTNGISSENGYVNLFSKVTIPSSQQDCAIFSKGDINLEGGADITAKGIGLCSAEGNIAVSEKTNITSGKQCVYIPSENTLWLDGDTILTLTGRDVPAVDVKGDVFINGNLIVRGNASASVSAGGAIETDGIVEIINGTGIGLYAENGPITINEGTWDITGTPAVKTKGDIDIPDTALVLIPENGPVGEFEDYSTVLDGDTAAEHVYIISSYLVSFDKGDKEAGGTMPTVFVDVDSDYELPACSFEAPAGKVFKEWSVKIGDGSALLKNPGEKIEISADTVVTAVWETPELPVFYGHSVILSGSIGMNFYVIIPDQYVAEGKMEFKVKNDNGNARYVHRDAVDAVKTDHGYLFTCYVTSVEMADSIQARFYYTLTDGKDSVRKPGGFIECTTSVESYLEILATDPAYSDAEYLAMAINNYGYYAQKSLSDGPNHVQMTGTYDELPLPEELDKSYPITFSPTDDITGGSFSLSLDSETMINFYLSPASAVTGTVAVTKGNSSVEFEEKTYNGMYLISIPGIAAHQLGDAYTVTIDVDPIISGSALSYVEKTWDNENLTEATRNTSKALYGYYQEAMAYRQATGN